jgi:hypothetical protein
VGGTGQRRNSGRALNLPLDPRPLLEGSMASPASSVLVTQQAAGDCGAGDQWVRVNKRSQRRVSACPIRGVQREKGLTRATRVGSWKGVGTQVRLRCGYRRPIPQAAGVDCWRQGFKGGRPRWGSLEYRGRGERASLSDEKGHACPFWIAPRAYSISCAA